MAKRGPAAKLLAWYDGHARALPWRAKPGETPDPYRVWLSEIMLQQTTVAAVAPYFAVFVARWPTLAALARASLDDVLKAWAGLGYYARARNLHACARKIVALYGGRFPSTVEELQQLPGIGPYTAAAVAAIAFATPVAAVDGNAERVIARLHAVEVPLPKARAALRRLAQALVPARRPGDFAQALMDLGAAVCTLKTPDCANCPWTNFCAARRLGLAAALPRRLRRKPVPTRRGVAFWLERTDGAVVLRRRPEKGLLGGMMELPTTAWTAKAPRNAAALAPIAAGYKAVAGRVDHTFTHFRLVLKVMKAQLPASADCRLPSGDYRWVHRRDLAGEALPTVMRKVAALVTRGSPR
jgi:A/G-specific adenine glycosylase